MALIEFSGIEKRFGSTLVLKGVSLAVEQGSFVTLLGPSGCGKTTLLRTLAGFYKQDGGDVYIRGKCVNDTPPEARQTPLVFQDYALFPHMTIQENIGYGLKLMHLPKAEILSRVQQQLKIFSLEGLEKRFPRQLSGGQQQRVAFARALAVGYDILLLDEPLSNLDAKLRVEVREELRRIQRQTGVTVIYVTHDQEEALAMSDVVAVMHRGAIVQVGAPEAVYNRPNSRFVADFIGSVNLIPAEDCQVLGCPDIDAARRESALAVVRPEWIALTAAEGAPVTGEIVDATFLGRMARYTVRTGNIQLMVDHIAPARARTPGEAVGLAFDWDRVSFIEEEP